MRKQHWLTVARKGCGYVCGEDGLCYQHAGLPAAPCPDEPEHQRTAQLLQREVEPLKAKLVERESDLEALGGQASFINAANTKLLEALRQYGAHADQCMVSGVAGTRFANPENEGCDCGLAATLLGDS